jgi:hypothetical protein
MPGYCNFPPPIMCWAMEVRYEMIVGEALIEAQWEHYYAPRTNQIGGTMKSLLAVVGATLVTILAIKWVTQTVADRMAQ